MHPQRIDAGCEHRAGEVVERNFGILLVDADPAFHRNGNGDRLLHRRDAFTDQRRRPHKAGAERARLHTVGRAADIEVDLAIAEAFADARSLRELFGVGAAELQRDRLLERIEAK